MNRAPASLLRHWRHSFEEDREDTTVYRPREHELPSARGRAGLELHPDGTFVEWAIGRGDANQAVPGTWATEADGSVRLTYASGARAARRLEILEQGPDILKVRVHHD